MARNQMHEIRDLATVYGTPRASPAGAGVEYGMADWRSVGDDLVQVPSKVKLMLAFLSPFLFEVDFSVAAVGQRKGVSTERGSPAQPRTGPGPLQIAVHISPTLLQPQVTTPASAAPTSQLNSGRRVAFMLEDGRGNVGNAAFAASPLTPTTPGRPSVPYAADRLPYDTNSAPNPVWSPSNTSNGQPAYVDQNIAALAQAPSPIAV